MTDEQRREPRVARAFMVRYRALSPESQAWLLSPLRDLSQGGVRFVSERAFEVGTLLELQLVLPTAPAPMAARGRVTWSKPGPMALPELGVTFEGLDPQTQQALQGAVKHFLERGTSP
jgi:hypothetical protein